MATRTSHTASSPTSRSIEMRPVEQADQRFLEQLYASTRVADQRMDGCDARTEALLVALQFRARQAQLGTQYPYGDIAVIFERDRPIGSLYVNYGPDDIRIVDIGLLPEYRNRGIGLGLLRSLQAQAVRMRVPVRLDLLLSSPAYRLFQRCGFVLRGANGLHNSLEWTPPLLA